MRRVATDRSWAQRRARCVAAFEPADPGSAARAVFALCLTVVVTVTLVALIEGPKQVLSSRGLAMFLAVSVACLAASWAVRQDPKRAAPAWFFAPLLAILLIFWLTITVRDAALRVDIYLLFPAVYGSRQLKYSGAAVTFVLCAAAEVAARLITSGWHGFVYVLVLDSAILVIGVRLTLTGRRLDRQLRDVERLARTDALTGLATRRAFDEAAARRLSVPRLPARRAALLLLDLDNFKQINDRFGHPAGDEALRELSRLVAERCRSSDIAGRFGGDEIAVFFDDISPEVALERAEALREAVAAREFVLPGAGVARLTISVGVALAPDHGDDIVRLYTNADAALYRAKRSGRNRVRSFASVMNDTVINLGEPGGIAV